MSPRRKAVLRFLVGLKVCSLMGAGLGAIFGVSWYWGGVCGGFGFVLGELQRARIGARLW